MKKDKKWEDKVKIEADTPRIITTNLILKIHKRKMKKNSKRETLQDRAKPDSSIWVILVI